MGLRRGFGCGPAAAAGEPSATVPTSAPSCELRRDRGVQRDVADPEEAVLDAPGRYELIGERFRCCDRNGEADALRRHTRLGFSSAERIDPDDLPSDVHKWTAGVPGVD